MGSLDKTAYLEDLDHLDPTVYPAFRAKKENLGFLVSLANRAEMATLDYLGHAGPQVTGFRVKTAPREPKATLAILDCQGLVDVKGSQVTHTLDSFEDRLVFPAYLD